jgi:methionyl-tRNA formyltransferase
MVNFGLLITDVSNVSKGCQLTLRTLFFGMGSAFSAIPFARLLDVGASIAAVVVPAPAGAPGAEPLRKLPLPPPLHADIRLQAGGECTILTLAYAQRIPVLEVRAIRSAVTHDALAALRPDVIFTACFPFIIPGSLLRLAPYGAYNLHPSLLPKLRGPEPLFWTFRTGAQPGVTLHRMTARADAGDIVAQAPLTFPDGITYAEAERLSAKTGAELMVDALAAIADGTLTAHPQDERTATYFSSPSASDLVVTPEWQARQAFNFLRAVRTFGQPMIEIDDRFFVIRYALELHPGQRMTEPYHIDGDRMHVRFSDGVLVCAT